MFETNTRRGCIYIDRPSIDLIGQKGASHDYNRRHRHVDVPRGELRRRGGGRPHPVPDHARANERPRGGIGQHAVEGLVPHAPCADQPAPRGLRLHRGGEGPRSPVGPIRSAAASRSAIQRGDAYLGERPSCLDEAFSAVERGLDSDRGCTSHRRVATSPGSNR